MLDDHPHVPVAGSHEEQRDTGSGVLAAHLLERADEHVGVLEPLDVHVVAQPAHADRATVGHVDHEGAHAVGGVEGAHEAVCRDVAAEDDGAEVGGRGVGHARSSGGSWSARVVPARAPPRFPQGMAAPGIRLPGRPRSPCPGRRRRQISSSRSTVPSGSNTSYSRGAHSSWVRLSSGGDSRRSRPGGPLDAGCARPRPGATPPPHRGALAQALGARQVPATTRAVPSGVPLVERRGRGCHEVPDLVGVVGHLVGLDAEVLGHQLAPHPQRERVARRLPRAALGHPRVLHGAGDLGVARPRPPVEVVGAHAGPHVVDDADLGVHVDRVARLAREPVDGDPVTARLEQQVHRQLAPVELRRQRDGAVLVGEDRDDGDEAQLGVLAQGRAEVPADLLRPEVLVLEVDQPLGVGHGPGVGVGHAAFPGRGEVVALGQDRGVGAQDLHGLRRVGRATGRGRLLAERPGGEVLSARQARQQPARVEGQGVVSSHRSRKVVSTSNTAGPSTARCTSCHAGRRPNAAGIGMTWSSPSWSMSSRRLWHRSMPPR